MKIPKRIQPLVDDGLVDKVLSRLMSGKEADVYVVTSHGEIRCAKVYKEAAQRSFKKAVTYQEGRKVRNTRRNRAMEKGSKYGRKQQEESWQNAEIDALQTLHAAGVRVPETFGCLDGVLLMELITDADGDVAPRLGDVTMSAEQAIEDHYTLMTYIMRMLCAGVVHGDLSEFNVLVDQYGPVIIDLQFAPQLLNTYYAQEMWELYENAQLTFETELTGNFKQDTHSADVDSVMLEIKSIIEEENARQERLNASQED